MFSLDNPPKTSYNICVSGLLQESVTVNLITANRLFREVLQSPSGTAFLLQKVGDTLLDNGYIKIYRSMLKWEWYDDINTKVLFLHLLLTVNYEPQKWRGILIERGQRVSSYGKLSQETGLTIQNVRTAIKHLISTGELTHEPHAEYGIFKLNNYNKYQALTDELTQDQQSPNNRPTVDQQSANNKERKNNKAKKDNKEKEVPAIVSEIRLTDEWKAYIEMRVKLKKPMTEHAMDLAEKELEKLAANDIEKQKAILNQSVFKSWQGLFPLSDNTYTEKLQQPTQKTFSQIIAERKAKDGT